MAPAGPSTQWVCTAHTLICLNALSLPRDRMISRARNGRIQRTAPVSQPLTGAVFRDYATLKYVGVAPISRKVQMRILATLTILTMSIALADRQAGAQVYGGPIYGRWAYESAPTATACKGAYGAIRAIASSPTTPNARPPRAVQTPIADSIPTTRSRASGAATIGPDTKRSEQYRGSRAEARSPEPFNMLLHD